MSPIIERGGSKILETEAVINMPKNAFIIIGPPTSGKSTQGKFLTETIRAHEVRGREILPELSDELSATRTLVPDDQFLPALAKRLMQLTSPNIVFDNIPRTLKQVETVMTWAQQSNVIVHIIRLELNEDEVVDRASSRLVCPKCGESYSSVLKPSTKPGICDRDGITLDKRKGDDPGTIRKGYRDHEKLDEELVTQLENHRAIIHRLAASGTTAQTATRLFEEVSPIIFYKAEMARGYFSLTDVLTKIESRHLFFSGVPVFLYGGRALMKDFDIIVPDNKIDQIGRELQINVGVKDSSVAYTRYVDIAPGVETNSNVIVKAPNQRISFPFDFLYEEVVFARFMGTMIPIMGLEDTILFKAALGRLGVDDWGKHKDDISDIEGLWGSQNVNKSKLIERAKQLDMLPRLKSILDQINISL